MEVKLIRDKLPDKYNLPKEKCPSEAYPILLGNKLVEEATEVSKELKPSTEEVNRVRLIEELADVKEAFDTILELYHIDIEDVEDIQYAKATLNGNLKEGYIIEKK